ncbi:MAG TPA: YdcF family protein [Geothrix sp.]|nr:YdcF family protein [Geothrix sp.]
MTQAFHAPPRASFLQKLGPGGAVSLGLAFATAIGLLGLPWLYRLRQVLRMAHGDEAAPADAILVLGRRLDRNQITPVFEARLAKAAALWRLGIAPRIFVAGGTTGDANRSEAEVGLEWLLAQGVPGSSIHLEDRSQHTLENLFNIRAQMRALGCHSLLLVSDPLHLARARATAEGLSLRVACVPAQDCPPRRGGTGWWWRAAQEAFLLHWYHTGMLYSRLIRSERQLERVT